MGRATHDTLRHTCASILFGRGYNAKQVQKWLGHHAASFTLDTYIHLLDDELTEPKFFDELVDESSAAANAKHGNTRPARARHPRQPPELKPGTHGCKRAERGGNRYQDDSASLQGQQSLSR